MSIGIVTKDFKSQVFAHVVKANIYCKNESCELNKEHEKDWFQKMVLTIQLWSVYHSKFKKSYDLPLDLLQYRRENSAEYLYSKLLLSQ